MVPVESGKVMIQNMTRLQKYNTVDSNDPLIKVSLKDEEEDA